MSAPAQDDPLDAFKQRAADRARLWHLGKIALHDAVDVLEADARRAGLDTDTAQKILHEAFRPFKEAERMTEREEYETHRGSNGQQRTEAGAEGVRLDDFYAYMLGGYIFAPTRDIWTAANSTAGCNPQKRVCRPAHGWIKTSRSSK
jgi:hypothetical protein